MISFKCPCMVITYLGVPSFPLLCGEPVIPLIPTPTVMHDLLETEQEIRPDSGLDVFNVFKRHFFITYVAICPTLFKSFRSTRGKNRREFPLPTNFPSPSWWPNHPTPPNSIVHTPHLWLLAPSVMYGFLPNKHGVGALLDMENLTQKHSIEWWLRSCISRLHWDVVLHTANENPFVDPDLCRVDMQ